MFRPIVGMITNLCVNPNLGTISSVSGDPVVGETMSFLWVIDTHGLDFLWHLPWVPIPGWIPRLSAS